MDPLVLICCRTGWFSLGGYTVEWLEFRSVKGKADAFLDDLMSNIASASPMKRRELIEFLRNLEFLYPLRQDNPKRANRRVSGRKATLFREDFTHPGYIPCLAAVSASPSFSSVSKSSWHSRSMVFFNPGQIHISVSALPT